MNDYYAKLDVEELMHLALSAIGRGDHPSAISGLKRAIELQPEHGRARFLLGAQYAEIGMLDRAADELTNALRIDPEMDMARFQLGLLHLTAGAVEAANETWQPFDALDASHPLLLFKKGLLCMVRDEFDDARMFLREGIVRNTFSPALNRDMANVLTRIDEVAEEAKAQAQAASPEPAAEEDEHIGVSAYKAG
jgi:tetratricopeptide (TPR) repeat protein